jgi:hypothetical protein
VIKWSFYEEFLYYREVVAVRVHVIRENSSECDVGGIGNCNSPSVGFIRRDEANSFVVVKTLQSFLW